MKMHLSESERCRLGHVVAIVTAVWFVTSCARQEPADLVLTGGKVLTVDRDFSIQSTVVIRDGKILAVGADAIARRYKARRMIDLKGRVLMPGFTDTHLHVFGRARRDVELASATSITQVQQLVRDKAKELGPGQWITGYGWDEAKFSEQRNIVGADLDVAAPDNPVALTRAGGHSIVGNARAMHVAGITRTTADPPQGLIERNSKGEPNGIVRESLQLYSQHFPLLEWSEVRDSYVATLRSLLALGITSLMEASGTIDDEPVGKGGIEQSDAGSLTERLTYRRVRDIYERHGAELPRIALYINYPGAERLKAFPFHTGDGDERVRLGPIGESPVDGGFTGPTAWTLADYKGQPGFRGRGRYTDSELQELVDTSAELGWQLGLHAIGDAAIVQTVNAYSYALRASGAVQKDHRWFLDHFTMLPPEQTMQVMAADKIMIAQQPNFSYTLEGRYAQTLDEERVAHLNSVATPAKKYGLFVALGSDNLPIGPLIGLYAAVTRKGMSGAVHGVEEAVSIQDAIRMYTANGPYLTFEEKTKGTIEVGKLADLIVLDRDPLTIAPEQLLRTQVDLTIVGGNIVFDRSQSVPPSGAP
jgi:predicted amidohydrolase YtcJ